MRSNSCSLIGFWRNLTKKNGVKSVKYNLHLFLLVLTVKGRFFMDPDVVPIRIRTREKQSDPAKGSETLIEMKNRNNCGPRWWSSLLVVARVPPSNGPSSRARRSRRPCPRRRSPSTATTWAGADTRRSLPPLPVTTNPRPGTRRRKVGEVSSSVVDPKLFIPDPAQALNFPSSGSGSRQKFRIHADPDPTCIIWVSIIRNNAKTPLKFNQKEES